MKDRWFKGRTLLIATKHGKEKELAPILESSLGVKCRVAVDFDSDILGTFTGEVERPDDPVTTVRTKCQMALKATAFDLVVGSEGSFGPHPFYSFIPGNEEFLMLLDVKHGLEIVVRELTTETNFSGSYVQTLEELMVFAEGARFPSHALILGKSKQEHLGLVKGITNPDKLKEHFNQLMGKYGSVYSQTDMRAHFNPMRMEVIRRAGLKLVHRIQSYCPACSCPGFTVTEVISGLPCSECGSPTRSTLAYRYVCQKCRFDKLEEYPNGKKKEDPTFCDLCNP